MEDPDKGDEAYLIKTNGRGDLVWKMTEACP